MINATGEVSVHRLTLASAAARLMGNAEHMWRMASTFSQVGEPDVVIALAQAAASTEQFARELAAMGGVDTAALTKVIAAAATALAVETAVRTGD